MRFRAWNLRGFFLRRLPSGTQETYFMFSRLSGSTLAAAVALALSAGAQAAPFVLTNGAGDGTVSVGVDGFGAFGSSVGGDQTDATYNPVGAGGAAGTTFESGVAVRLGTTGGARTFLTSGDIGGSGGLLNPVVSGTSTSGSSSFALPISGIAATLTQVLTPLFTGMTQTGSLLTQTYVFSSSLTSAATLEVIRYLDGDLVFDGSIADGGGRIFLGTSEVLFETDTAAGTATSTTFVGITGEGGTTPVTGRYEVDSYSGLRSRVISGISLDNLITGDGGDADQFVDAGGGYDVTLALRSLLEIAAGGSSTYVTRTIFGSGAPEDIVIETPEPGSLALLGLGALGLAALRRRRT